MKSTAITPRILLLGLDNKDEELVKAGFKEFKYIDGNISPEKIPQDLVCIIANNSAHAFEFLRRVGFPDTEKKLKYPLFIVCSEAHSGKLPEEIEEIFETECIGHPINLPFIKDTIQQKILVFSLKYELTLARQEIAFLQRKNTNNEHRLKVLSATVSEPIVFVDDNCRVTFWNKEAETVFGYSRYEIIDEDFLHWIIAGKSQQQVRQIFDNALKTGSRTLNTTQVFSARNKLGAEFETESTVSVQTLGKDNFNLVFVFHNVQNIKRLEREIAYNNELKEENKLMREFIHTVSHDLRTPMNSVLGIAKTLLKYNSANLTERQREGLDIIYRSGSDMANLVRDLLDLVRMERGKLEINNEYFDFDKLLSVQKTQVLHLIGTKKIKFIVKKSPSIPSIIIGDQRKTGQVLTNLLTNAVKFTDQGRITLSAHLIENRLFFEITDTGIGISEEKLKSISNKFSQASPAYLLEGIGLGLHISGKLVSMMKGEITFESTPGMGTTVRFYICLPDDKKLPGNAVQPNLPGKSNFTIINYKAGKKILLVIDDSEENQFIFSYIGETSNFAVVIVQNGKMALGALAAFRPEAVLVKLEIPGLHGTSIINEIRRISDKTLILAITDFQNLPISLPPDVVLVLQPLSPELVMDKIPKDILSSQLPKYKICIIHDEAPILIEQYRHNPEFSFLENNNPLQSFVLLNRINATYLVIEKAFSQNNTNLIFKIIDEGLFNRFKEIIVLLEGPPMKYLAQKTEIANNLRYMQLGDFDAKNLVE
ncbi:MAG: PAS domain S-box protein [Bacteroidales bacterium]|nr:PAS domain S-box protein [Bacteroidales bacterium]